MVKKIWLVLCVAFFCLLFLVGCKAQPTDSAKGTGKEISITMLDVGQGDAVLIETGAQKVLIDTGDADERDKLRRELGEAKVQELDKVILTHPHADHIGGMSVLLKEYAVKEIFDNGMPSTSPIYRAYMKTVKEKKIPRRALAEGDTLDFGNGAVFKVLSPTKETVKKGNEKGYKHNPNNESVVGVLTYGDFSMLFTGDAEKEIEQELIKTHGRDLKVNLLKSPHHGSKTSSSQKFLEAMRPEAVLISLGVNNEYGHPHEITLERYEKMGCKVYRTDEDGTIKIVTDGQRYRIEGEK